MNIGVLSDCRVPTLATGGHGLGRLAYRIYESLASDKNCSVTLYAGPGSVADAVIHADEKSRTEALDRQTHDVWIDLSHHHSLSQKYPEAPILNYIVDLECAYDAPNALTCNLWHQARHPKSKVLTPGIDVDSLELVELKADYVTFTHKLHPAKGANVALDIAQILKVPMHFVGENFLGRAIPNHRDNLDGKAFYEHLGKAMVLLSPSMMDAGGMVNLEAAACGTPVVCFDTCGTQHYVEHCVSGFICRDFDEMVDALNDIGYLSPRRMREWVADRFTTQHMTTALKTHCDSLLNGARW